MVKRAGICYNSRTITGPSLQRFRRIGCEYEVRRGSGGQGRYRGGAGIRRDIQLLTDAQASLITERRRHTPYGLAGGRPGSRGENVLIRNGVEYPLPGKGTVQLHSGDVLSIRTPGGGGYGVPQKDSGNS